MDRAALDDDVARASGGEHAVVEFQFNRARQDDAVIDLLERCMGDVPPGTMSTMRITDP